MSRNLMQPQAAYIKDIARAARVSPDAAALEIIKFVYDQYLAGGYPIAECFSQVLTAINYFDGVPSYPRANDRISQDHLGNPVRDAIEIAKVPMIRLN
jgi:hypothetical protein